MFESDCHPEQGKQSEEAKAADSHPVLDKKAEQEKFLESVTARYFPEHTLITETSVFFKPPVWPPQDPRKQKGAYSPLNDVDELYKAYKRAVEEDDADPMGLFGKIPMGRAPTIPPSVHLTQQQLRAQLASRSRRKGFPGQKKPGDLAARETPLKPQSPVSPLPLKQAGLGHQVSDVHVPAEKAAANAAFQKHGAGPRLEEAAEEVRDSARIRRAQAQLSFRPDTNLGSSPPSTKHMQRQQQLLQGLSPKNALHAAELQPPYSKASLPLPPVDRPKNAHSKQQAPPSNGVQIVANAPSIAPGGRGVHPFFLLGVLQHGLSGSPSAVITGTRTRKSHAVAVPPVGWSTAELVAKCVQPALGATRLSYVQALACNAAEVPWCPYGRFAPKLSPLPLKPGKSALQHHSQPFQSNPADALPSHPHAAASSSSSSSSSSQSQQQQQQQQQQCQSIEVQLSGGGTSVPLPADLAGKSVYGSASYFLSHPWNCNWAELVGAVLQHYMRLPEVQRTEGKKFVPVYYWVDVFAVPQAESQQSSEFKHHRADVLDTVAAHCQAMLLLLARPCFVPPTRSHRRTLSSGRTSARSSVPLSQRRTSLFGFLYGSEGSRPSSVHSSYRSPRAADRNASGGTRRGDSLLEAADAAAAVAEEEEDKRAAAFAQLAPALPPLALSRAWCLYECGLAMTLGIELQILLPDEHALPPLLPPSYVATTTIPASPLLGNSSPANSNRAPLSSSTPQTHSDAQASSTANKQASQHIGPPNLLRVASQGNISNGSCDGLEVTMLTAYIEECLMTLVQDIRQAHTTLRADLDFIVTQAGLSFGGPQLFTECLRDFLRPHLLSAVLLVVLRAAKRHISPACMLSPEQVVPPHLDTSHLTSRDPTINSNLVPGGSHHGDVDWRVASYLAEAGAILQWLQPSFVVSVPCDRAAAAGGGVDGSGKWRTASHRSSRASGFGDSAGCGSLYGRERAPSPQYHSSSFHSSSMHPSMYSGLSMKGGAAGGGPSWACSADEAAAFFGTCLQRSLPQVNPPPPVLVPSGAVSGATPVGAGPRQGVSAALTKSMASRASLATGPSIRMDRTQEPRGNVLRKNIPFAGPQASMPLSGWGPQQDSHVHSTAPAAPHLPNQRSDNQRGKMGVSMSGAPAAMGGLDTVGKNGGGNSACSSPRQILRARKSMRESGLLSVPSGNVEVGSFGIGAGSGEGGVGHWACGGWGAAHEGGVPNGLYSKDKNRLQMLIFEDPGDSDCAVFGSRGHKGSTGRGSSPTKVMHGSGMGKAMVHALGSRRSTSSSSSSEEEAEEWVGPGAAGKPRGSRGEGLSLTASLSSWTGAESPGRMSTKEMPEWSQSHASLNASLTRHPGPHSQWSLTVQGVASLAPGLQANTRLTHLSLSGHAIGNSGVEVLVDALQVQPSALQVLLLRRCKLGSRSGGHLGELLTVHPKLQILDLSENRGLGPEGISAIAQGLASNRGLQQLLLSNCRACTNGAIAIAEALAVQQQQQQQGHTEGFSPFMAPAGTSGLQVLSLRRNQIDQGAGPAFAAALSHPGCMLTTLYLGDNKLETKGALDIAAGLSAVSQGCSLRTLELRHNGLALEAGDAFGSLLAGARMPCPASPPHPPQHAASRRSRVAGKAGPATLAALASGHLSASAATSASAASPLPSSRQQLQHMTTSGGSMPGSAAGSMRHRMGTAAVLAGHPSAQPLAGGAAVASGSCRDLSTSSPRPGTVPGQPLLSPAAVPSGLPVAAAALPESLQAIGSEGVSVLEQQQQQQLEAELMLVSACHLTTLDLGCNPLLGDVGVCKLAAGLAIHCRRYGRLRELLLDACGVGAEGTAALVAAIVQQPPQQQQMGQSQDEQQLRKQRKQHHQREQQQLGQLRNSSAGALKTSLDGTGNRGSFAGEKGALSSGVITSSDAGMLGASISGSVAVSAAARPGKGLLSLELSNNAIGKQGLHALSGAVPLMATLQELLLRDCQIDTDGRLTLLAALQLYTGCPLRHLDLRGNGINPAEYTPPPVLDPPHHLPHVSAIPDSLAHFSSSHHPSGPKAFPTGPVNTASPHALCTDDQGRSLSPSSLGPKQVGLRQFKELLCASQGLDHQGQDGSQHEDDENAGMDTDRIDLTGGQDGGLNTTRRTASAEVATKGRMVEGLSRHERDLAQSLNLARKLRAAPRGMLIEM